MKTKGCIQAEVYRAPEVILDVGFTYSEDIWSLGVMVRYYICTSSRTAIEPAANQTPREAVGSSRWEDSLPCGKPELREGIP